MKARIAIVLAAITFLCGFAEAASVGWIDGIGATAPTEWSISPAHPSTTDVISFSGPTDKVYGNSCNAEAAYGGTPYLSINSSTKTIELKFQGPAPSVCPLIYKPAVGFRGEFGPLAAGNWTLKCTQPLIAFQLAFTVGGGSSGGQILRVDRNAPLAIWTPDGSSWTRAYRNLQDALAVARSGDTIRVADGVYKPDDGAAVTPGDRAASFEIPDGVTVMCGYAGYGAANPDARNINAYPTILSGDLNGNDLWGILNLSDNSFHVVTASGSGTLSGATITAGNADGSGNHRYGGGVLLTSSTLRIENCKIKDNKADFGAGVACLEGIAPVLINTEITGNWAYTFGGCLYNDDANVEMTNCLVVGNTAGSANILGGDAILNVMGSLDITNCTIADNRPGHSAPANKRAIVNLIWGPGFVDTISIKNSIIRNGGTEIWSTEPSLVTLHRNNIEGGAAGFAGSGNINQNPLFKNPGAFGIEGQWFFTDDGYTLLAGSPSIDAGNQALLPPGLTVDLKGNARVQGGQVDQGAYESGGLPPAVVLVPNVVGQTQSTAQSMLTSAGLVVGTISNAYSSTVPVGRVISQNPTGGSTAVVGSAVNLTISLGPSPGSSWTLEKTSDISLTVPNPVPSHLISVSGAGTWTFTAVGTTEYKIEATSVAGVGGTWFITPSSGTVSSGVHTISFTMNGVNLNVSGLTPGDHKIAEIKFYTR
ncbi:MAG TPA: PASTA domain-containing protein [Sedimentisphaerales bacterium]|nr:PASTA domain-containing protein [Sedimentisphaerales bacterium]